MGENKQANIYYIGGYRVKEDSILDWVVREGFPEEVTFNQSLK